MFSEHTFVEYTVAGINSDVEWLTHSRDIWLAESECYLQIKLTHESNTANEELNINT